MPQFYILALFYLLLINLIAAAATILDKKKAKAHQWRIPEKTLLLLSALGGSPAMLITMHLIHHKTKHKKFMLGIPAILLLQTGFLWIVLQNWLK